MKIINLGKRKKRRTTVIKGGRYEDLPPHLLRAIGNVKEKVNQPLPKYDPGLRPNIEGTRSNFGKTIRKILFDE